MLKLLPFLILLGACSNPLDGRGKLVFRDLNQEQRDALEKRENAQRERELFQKEEKRIKILKSAQSSFEDIKPILEKKCFDCHDKGRTLGLYARVFPRFNPLYKHQQDGIKALDFSQGYPLSAEGNPTQLSLLKSLKNAVMDKSMPLKAYRTIYRSRSLTHEDQIKIQNWVDPIIQDLEEFEARYEMPVGIQGETQKLFEMKCFRCHAHGVAKGGFGQMEDMNGLALSQFVNLKDPSASKIYTLSESRKMPPNKNEALTQNELILLKDWIIQESQKLSNP